MATTEKRILTADASTGVDLTITLAAGGLRAASQARTKHEMQAAIDALAGLEAQALSTGADAALTKQALAQVRFLLSYFKDKTAQDLAGTMQHYSPNAATYTDAVMGWGAPGYEGIQESNAKAMPNWGNGLSYPTAIMGGMTDSEGSFLVAFTDTPGIVGNEEVRILAAIDVREGRIVRQVDYWDSAAFDDAAYTKLRVPAEQFPREYKEDVVGVSASPVIVDVATRLQTALAAADPEAATDCFDDDAVLEDMALRVQVIGKTAIERYLERLLPEAPFGAESRLRHIVGGSLGGGFEWIGSSQTRVADGITALTLDPAEKVIRATFVYDGRQLGEEKKRALILLSTAP